MKFRLFVDNKVKEYSSLEEAVKMLKMITGRCTIGVLLASKEKNEARKNKNNNTIDSIRLEIAND